MAVLRRGSRGVSVAAQRRSAAAACLPSRGRESARESARGHRAPLVPSLRRQSARSRADAVATHPQEVERPLRSCCLD